MLNVKIGCSDAEQGCGHSKLIYKITHLNFSVKQLSRSDKAGLTLLLAVQTVFASHTRILNAECRQLTGPCTSMIEIFPALVHLKLRRG